MWRASLGLLATALVLLGQVNSDEKPSPVPARTPKTQRPAPLARSSETYTSATPAPANIAPSGPVVWDSPQGGSAVFFADNVRGKKAASGALLDPDDMIAAHASLPFGTLVRITNTKNGKEAVVRIVDRISASSGHVISVSERAARELDFRRQGIGQVKIIPVTQP